MNWHRVLSLKSSVWPDFLTSGRRMTFFLTPALTLTLILHLDHPKNAIRAPKPPAFIATISVVVALIPRVSPRTSIFVSETGLRALLAMKQRVSSIILVALAATFWFACDDDEPKNVGFTTSSGQGEESDSVYTITIDLGRTVECHNHHQLCRRRAGRARWRLRLLHTIIRTRRDLNHTSPRDKQFFANRKPRLINSHNIVQAYRRCAGGTHT